MISRIVDTKLDEIYEFGICPQLPHGLGPRSRRIVTLLLAAESLDDIIWPYAKLPDGRFAVHVHAKWCVVFLWDATANLARDLALIRL